MKNIFKIILIGAIVVLPKISFGADLFVKTPVDSYRIGEQFVVSVFVSSEEQNPINAVDLSFGFSQENLKFITSLERGSIISFFVDKPELLDGKIVFSGITPGGFFGAVNPVLDVKSIEPVKIIDFIFEPIASGRAEIFLDKGEMFRNDGSGLPVVFNEWSKILEIKDEVFKKEIDLMDENPPLEFTPEIIKDKNISSNYILIFNTTDEETGIDRYEVLEEGRKVVVTESPYVLKNKPPKGIITVRAYDKAENVRVAYIEAPKTPDIGINIFLIVGIILIIVLLAIRKKTKGGN